MTPSKGTNTNSYKIRTPDRKWQHYLSRASQASESSPEQVVNIVLPSSASHSKIRSSKLRTPKIFSKLNAKKTLSLQKPPAWKPSPGQGLVSKYLSTSQNGSATHGSAVLAICKTPSKIGSKSIGSRSAKRSIKKTKKKQLEKCMKTAKFNASVSI